MRYTPDTDFLREWLEETEGGPPDPAAGTSKAMSHLDETKQASRWWPFPVFYGKAKTTARPPTTTDTDEFQPSRIPATNGRSPTVIGRTTSMLSPVKAIAAGALVFAIGGTLLIAQPFQQQGNVPGAESGVAAAAWVTGNVVFGPDCEDPMVSTEDGVFRQRGFRCGTSSPQQWQSDDPRFAGDGIVAYNSDTYDTDGGRYQVISSAFEVRNDDGGWNCTNADALAPGMSLFDASLLEFRMTCVGDGDYTGMTAILVVDFTDFEAPTKPFEGLVFPGEVPPFSETSPEE